MTNSTPIRALVGLGNPGAEYAATRHNAGFWLIDLLARQAGVTLRHDARFKGCAARATLHGQDIWLLQPQTFMNRSGLPVVSLAKFFRILPNEIVVAHDELDLPPGTVKLKFGGGTGGHNGLKDIGSHLSTPDYWRLRIGIGHPRNLLPEGAAADVANFVLKPPRKEEQQLIDASIGRIVDVMPLIAGGAMERAMMELHRSR